MPTTVTVSSSSNSNLADAIRNAGNGDTLLAADGVYGPIDTAGKSDLTIVAANTGKAIINGRALLNGRNTLRGFVVQGARTDWSTGMVLITGDGATIEDFLVRDGTSIGIDVHGGTNATIRRGIVRHCASQGIGSGDANGKRCGPILVEDVIVEDINFGHPNPGWSDINNIKKFRQSGGLWYRLVGDAGGPIKLCTGDKFTLRRVTVRNSRGIGIWFDVYTTDMLVDDCEAYGLQGTPGGEGGWEGTGFATELNKGPTRFRNCYAHDNTGSGIEVWEANQVTIENCVLNAKGVYVRYGGGDRANQGMIDDKLVINGLKLYNGAGVNYDTRLPANIRAGYVLNGIQNLTGPAVWIPGGITPPIDPTPPPVPVPGVESPDGTRGLTVVNAAGTVFTVTSNKRIATNGVEDPNTSAVEELGYKSKVVYQKAHATRWWKLVGSSWQETTDPFTATPPPPPVPPPTDDVLALKAEILALTLEVAALTAKLDAATPIGATVKLKGGASVELKPL